MTVIFAAKPLADVIAGIQPPVMTCGIDRYLQVCEETATHVRAMTFEGDVAQRKRAMLIEAVRFRNERVAS